MAVVRNCHLPDELFYDIDSSVWARREPDGMVTVGMTSCACTLIGELVAFQAKKPGSHVEQGKALASIESGKWVGPLNAPVAGRIVAINDAATARPSLVNADPYGRGWAVRLEPDDWQREVGRLVTGAAAAAAFEAKMNADGLACR